jgi:hypothetical protein
MALGYSLHLLVFVTIKMSEVLADKHQLSKASGGDDA